MALCEEYRELEGRFRGRVDGVFDKDPFSACHRESPEKTRVGAESREDFGASYVVGVSYVSHPNLEHLIRVPILIDHTLLLIIRSYLPPPILATLDTQTLTAAKRAALLTTALKYALDRVPLAIVPAPAQPAMRLCKAFTPYLGYVGGFVAWSWGAVKGFDKGYGVTLSATWLLSVAVVPGTWESPKEEERKEGEDGKEKEKQEKKAAKDLQESH